MKKKFQKMGPAQFLGKLPFEKEKFSTP